MKNLKIITTVYNAEKYISTCIDSVLNQNYKNWNWIIIDDNSTDSTYDIILKKIKFIPNIISYKNKNNIKAIANYIKYLPEVCLTKEDIIISLDGDDWLYGTDVLEYINYIYENNRNLWVTYGQYVTASNLKINNKVKGCSRIIKDLSEVRKEGVNFSHLKTWKYGLWEKLNKSDLKRWDGKYVQRAWDFFMRPLIEMAGLNRVKYIDKILYVYNNLNVLNEYKIDEKEQTQEDEWMRKNIKVYSSLC